MDWSALFAMDVPPAEIFARGTAIYWFLFLAFRFVLRRNAGALGLADVLLLVIIADAAQNAMSGSYDTVTEGILLISTILGWNLLLDQLAYRFPAIARFAEPAPLLLIDQGRMLPSHLRKEYITVDELMGQLRLQGVESLDEVKAAWMESDGKISVIRRPGPEKNTARGAIDAATPGT